LALLRGLSPTLNTISIHRNRELWFCVEVDPYATVSALKDVISKKTSLYPAQQRLVFRGTVLANEMSLFYYNITHGSKIYFVSASHRSRPYRLLDKLRLLLDQLSNSNSLNASDLISQIRVIIEDPVIESLTRIDSAAKHTFDDALKLIGTVRPPAKRGMRDLQSRGQDLFLDQFDNSPEGIRILRLAVEEVLNEENARALPFEPTRIRPTFRISERPLPNPWPRRRREGPLYASGLRLSLGPVEATAMSEFAREIEVLREMGFNDQRRMLHALAQAKGNVHLAAQLLERGVC
jgi:hypothetical protein